MKAILKREFNAYFTSPIGYVFLAVFYLFAGFFLFASVLASNSTDISPVFSSLYTVLMFIIPILTMRLLSEDKKQKTDQALLTAPIGLWGLVFGKFLAAFVVFSLGVAITVVYALAMALYNSPDWLILCSNLLGILLLGGALISIGLFISSLTENQVIAAVGGFSVMMVFMMLDVVANSISIGFVSKVILAVTFSAKYNEFTLGMPGISNILYFISVITVFMFLTVRVLDKKRWN